MIRRWTSRSSARPSSVGAAGLMHSARSSVSPTAWRSTSSTWSAVTARPCAASRSSRRSIAGRNTNTSCSKSVDIVVEHDPLVGRLGRRERHERIPALARRELIQPVRLPAEPLEDAAAGQPHHLAELGDAEPRERVAQLRIEIEPREWHRRRGRALVGIAAQDRDAAARRARDRVRREPREPDDDRAGVAERRDRALDRDAPRVACRTRSARGPRRRARTCPAHRSARRAATARAARSRSSVIAAAIRAGDTTRARNPRCRPSACA